LSLEEVEADRLRHDRHVHAPDLDADPALAHPGLHAGCGVEPEARAAGEHDGVDPLDRHLGLEAGGVAVRRRAAEGEAGCDDGLLEKDDRHPGGERLVMGVADTDAGHVGDEVAKAGHYE
jgi:hypothetical protein